MKTLIITIGYILAGCGSGSAELDTTRGAHAGLGTGSCEDSCGSQSQTGDCWCDAECATYGDCCADRAQICEGAGGLTPIESCGELTQKFRETTAERMQKAVQTERERALQMVENPESSCIRPFRLELAASGATQDQKGNDSADAYSTTNNQVANVDEADFVKNDGSYIYLLSGEQFQVLDAWPAASTHVRAQVAIEGRPQALFVENGRALIYSRIEGTSDCEWTLDGFARTGDALKLTVLDISTPEAPTLERELKFNGQYVGARRIGDKVHTAVHFRDNFYGTLKIWPDDLPRWLCGLEQKPTKDDVNAAFDKLVATNVAAINATQITDFLPSAIDIDHTANGPVQSSGLFYECSDYYFPQVDQGTGFLSVVSVDLDNDKSLHAATIFGRAGAVYASKNSLYVAIRTYDLQGGQPGMGLWMPRPINEETVIHRFSLQGGKPAYRSTGQVKGHLVNQFAMDEHKGKLRVATTEGFAGSTEVTNNVFVLEERVGTAGPGPELKVVGSITGIAKTEDIRSVRFDGDRGFMVTFKKTDPLFAFDLSDPRAPKITGELKIPGFSTYMHFLDKDHLLTIGFDAADQGGFAWFTGIQLQIFDVSNPANLRLTHKETIGSRGTTSDATGDHLAFNYFADKNLLAIPMGICDGGDTNGGYGSTLTFNGLLLYRVTPDGGFEKLGGIDHRDANEPQSGADYTCYSWWQNPNSQVKRSVFMSGGGETYVYSLSQAQLKVNRVSDVASDLQTLALPKSELPQENTCGWLPF